MTNGPLIDALNNRLSQRLQLLTVFLFLLLGSVLLMLTRHAPIGDFGNYYYGSRLLLDGKFDLRIYTDIAWFNEQIAGYGETRFFENYIPVPPFSAVFYLPFCGLAALKAKLAFNLFGLLVFAFSFYRLLRYVRVSHWLVLLVPFVFVYPLYTNFAQGQAYLLVAALLIEVFLASEAKRDLLASFLLALVISLKLFPGIAILYFIIKKKYRIALLTLLFTVLLCLVVVSVAGEAVMRYYIGEVFPRLINNDVTGTYYHSNQSLYTFLLNLFSYDGLHNPAPLGESVFLISLLESVLTAAVVYALFELRKAGNGAAFFMVVFCSILLARYSTSYGTFLILPCVALLVAEKRNPVLLAVCLLCLAFAINLPLSQVSTLPLFMKFVRLWGLLLFFVLVLFYLGTTIRFMPLCLLFVPLFCIRYLSFPVKDATYFPVQNRSGILYDYQLKGDSLELYSTLGDHSVIETVYAGGRLREDASLTLRGNALYYHGKLLSDSNDNKSKPCIFNDSTVLFMSDLNQGIRFYVLRTLPLR